MAPSLFKKKSVRSKDKGKGKDKDHHEASGDEQGRPSVESREVQQQQAEGEAGATAAGEGAGAEGEPEIPPEADKHVYEAGQLSQILKVIKQAVGLKDLDSLRVSLPASMHEGDSSLERMVQVQHPELLLSIPDGPAPLERHLAVTKWQIAHMQALLKFKKKPFNPLQGELYMCEWDLAQGKLQYESEQVSHHPPSAAFVCKSHDKGITYFGHDVHSASFTGTAMKLVPKGFKRVHLSNHNEIYEIKLPTLFIRGLIIGKPFGELIGEFSVTCKETGYKSKLHFKDKPWIGGHYHLVTGALYDPSHQEIAKFSGTWAKKIDITYKDKEPEVFFEASAVTPTEAILPPVGGQNPMESRRLWNNVQTALKSGDLKTADKEKDLLENLQRKQEGKEKFQPELFELDSASGLFHPKEFRDIETIRKEHSGWLPLALKEATSK